MKQSIEVRQRAAFLLFLALSEKLHIRLNCNYPELTFLCSWSKKVLSPLPTYCFVSSGIWISCIPTKHPHYRLRIFSVIMVMVVLVALVEDKWTCSYP